jgi:rhodanese-related sulfurtransferase
MSKSRIFNLAILIGMGTLLFFQTGLASKFSKNAIAPADTLKAVQSSTAILVDVREKEEVDQGMIQGAKWIPLSEITSQSPNATAELAKLDRSKEILLYCRSGGRSGRAAQILEKQGFKVRNAGGYSGLIGAGMKSTK